MFERVERQLSVHGQEAGSGLSKNLDEISEKVGIGKCSARRSLSKHNCAKLIRCDLLFVQDPDFDHKFLPVLMHNPGGDQFALLFLCFANYVAKKTMLKGCSLTNLPIDELRLKRAEQQALLEQTAKQFYDEKQQLLDGICEFMDKVTRLKCQLESNEADLQQLNARLMEKFSFCDVDKLKTEVAGQVCRIQSIIKPFDGWMQAMEELLQNEFKNESMIVDGRKFSSDGQPIDMVERFNCIKGKLELFKDILQKGLLVIFFRFDFICLSLS